LLALWEEYDRRGESGIGLKSMKLFAKIEHVFTVSGRGCVIVPTKPLGTGFPFSLRNNDPIQLRSPSGVIYTHIAAVESLNIKSGPRRVAFLLPVEIAKSDVLPDTEIWGEPSK
jgi:hypothetical protein